MVKKIGITLPSAPTGPARQRFGEGQAPTRPGPSATNSKFGMPGLPSLPNKVSSGVPGVPSLSAINRKSVKRFGA